MWEKDHEGVVCILAFCGIVYGFPVDFWWQVNTLLETEVLEAQDGAVVGVVRLLPSGLASSPLRILNEHFRL